MISDTNTASEHDSSSVTTRFPELAQLAEQDDEQRIETFQHVLDALQRELNESRENR